MTLTNEFKTVVSGDAPSKEEEQLKREEFDVDAALAKFRERVDESPGSSPIGHKLIEPVWAALEKEIKQLQDGRRKAKKLPKDGIFLLVLDSGSLALITLMEIYNAFGRKDSADDLPDPDNPEPPEDDIEESEEDPEAKGSHELPKVTLLV